MVLPEKEAEVRRGAQRRGFLGYWGFVCRRKLCALEDRFAFALCARCDPFMQRVRAAAPTRPPLEAAVHFSTIIDDVRRSLLAAGVGEERDLPSPFG